MAKVTKTYASKSNTIFKDSCANTGLNPVMEIAYGKGISRGVIYFDHNKVKKLVEDMTYPDMGKLRHTLKMTNTASLTEFMLHKPCHMDFYDTFSERATSFDIILFLLYEDWDMGKGFDYIRDMIKGQHIAYSQDACNWFQNKNYSKWKEEGIYSTDTLSSEYDKYTSFSGNLSEVIVGVQHFDYGNENIEIDITEIFNKFINGDVENYGFGIAFSPKYEEEDTCKKQYVGFYTQHTHSFYEPYIETTYNDTIQDDRVNFFLDKDNKLYFYSSVGGKYANLDEMPTCEVNGVSYEVKQATKGVYYIDINLSSEEYESDTMLYDLWSNIIYKGKTIKDVELQFVTKASDNYFSFGLPSLNNEDDIKPSLYGISDNERIKRGDVRKVNIDCLIPYTTNQQKSVDGLEYRVYVESGVKQIDIIGWTKVEIGYNENYFVIDTNDFIPFRYNIDIRVNKNLEVINHPKILQFDIVSDLTDNLV